MSHGIAKPSFCEGAGTRNGRCVMERLIAKPSVWGGVRTDAGIRTP